MSIELNQSDRARLVALRRAIHREPELAFDEHKTSGLVERELREAGYETERVAGTGVVCVLDTGVSGRTVLLRADLDALPVHEENEHAYRSIHDGQMHACGHDGHTAIMLTVARVLKRHVATLSGRFVFVFQPAEEIGRGADAMIEAGLLERYPADGALGLHLWSEAPTGQVLVTDGPFMASMDRFEVVVKGAGGHGAIPQSARDPVVAAAHMIVALQTVVSRNVAPVEAAVLTVGQVQGGDAFNVIPDRVCFGGTVRTFDEGVQDVVEERMKAVIGGLATAMGVEADVVYHRISRPVINDPSWAQLVRTAVADVADVELGEPGFQTMGGEDMASFLRRVPGCYFFVGAGNPAVGAVFPHHHPRFEIDEAALELGALVLCRAAARAGVK